MYKKKVNWLQIYNPKWTRNGLRRCWQMLWLVEGSVMHWRWTVTGSDYRVLQLTRHLWGWNTVVAAVGSFLGKEGKNAVTSRASASQAPTQTGWRQLQQSPPREMEARDTNGHICWDLTLSLALLDDGVAWRQRCPSRRCTICCLPKERVPSQSQLASEWDCAARGERETGAKLWGRTYGQCSLPEKFWHSNQDLSREAWSIISAAVTTLLKVKVKPSPGFCKE